MCASRSRGWEKTRGFQTALKLQSENRRDGSKNTRVLTASRRGQGARPLHGAGLGVLDAVGHDARQGRGAVARERKKGPPVRGRCLRLDVLERELSVVRAPAPTPR